MTDWLLIETAPRDETIILWGYWAGEIAGPSKKTEFLGAGKWCGDRTDYPGFNWRLEGGDAYATWGKPTHWMPMMEGPKDG